MCLVFGGKEEGGREREREREKKSGCLPRKGARQLDYYFQNPETCIRTNRKKDGYLNRMYIVLHEKDSGHWNKLLLYKIESCVVCPAAG